MSTRGAKRQWRIEQEDDNQSNINFEGIDVIDDFGPIIPSPSGEADPMAGSWLAFQRVHLCGSRIGSCFIRQSWSASSHGTAAASASRLCTSIQHNSATRNSHIFARWWCAC
jgi:hypothetical protein